MIVPMARIHLAARKADREALLTALRRLGMLHIDPLAPGRDGPDDHAAAALDRVVRALEALQDLTPDGEPPRLGAAEAVDEILEIVRRRAEAEERIARLRRQAKALPWWGGARLDDVRAIERAGITVRLWAVPDDAAGGVQGEVVRTVGRLGPGRLLVAAAARRPEELQAPPGAEAVPLPDRDPASLLDEARTLERARDRDARRLAALAGLRPALAAERDRLAEAAARSAAARAGIETEEIFALRGWAPADLAASLADRLARAGIPAGVDSRDPGPDETPPTLVRSPRWIRPIRSLFQLLEMAPGYRELDPSGFFMVALPLFAAMIIADAGYGLLFLGAALILSRRVRGPGHRARLQLLGSFGAAAVVWGAITGAWFSMTPTAMAEAGGTLGALGAALGRLQLVRGTDEAVWTFLMKLCFLIGTSHLVLARLRRAAILAPHTTALAELGWAVVLVAMLGVIWILFFGDAGPAVPAIRNLTAAGLAAGLALVVAFSDPDRNLARRLGRGLAGSLIPLIGTFSDTLSYIRLMAVGLAGFYLGSACNTLAAQAAGAAGWWAGTIVLVLGHSLNMGLILIAIFAHGVRLNLLEFSSHAGLQWTGYPYRPFAEPTTQE